MVEDSVNEKILRQTEYYFGDINLPRDKFLQEEMKKDDGWIDLNTMLKFNRLAQLTTDIAKIAAALEPSELLEVSEDKSKIRRSLEVPLPDNTLEYWQEIKRRTAYVKGFDPETTLDEIQAFLAPYGDVKNVVMRRFKKERQFKGSIFATFVDRETAEKFVKDEDSKTFKDKPLTKLLQDEYWAAKMKETKEKRHAEKQTKLSKKLEQIAEQEQTALNAKYEKGAVLEVSGLDKATKYDDLKTFFKQYGPVAFVAHESGDETARIRFNADTENVAKAAWEEALKTGDGKVLFNGKELTGKILEGEEEEKYWADFSKNKVAKHSYNKQKQGKFGRGGFGSKNKKNKGDFSKKSKHITFKDENADDEEKVVIKKEESPDARKRTHVGEDEDHPSKKSKNVESVKKEEEEL